MFNLKRSDLDWFGCNNPRFVDVGLAATRGATKAFSIGLVLPLLSLHGARN